METARQPKKTATASVLGLLMATPAWPTPMRALISKFNSSHAPECATDCGLLNRRARRAVASIPKSSILNRRLYSDLLRRGPVRIRHRTPPQWWRNAIYVGRLVMLEYVVLLTAVTSESLEARCLLPKRQGRSANAARKAHVFARARARRRF